MKILFEKKIIIIPTIILIIGIGLISLISSITIRNILKEEMEKDGMLQSDYFLKMLDINERSVYLVDQSLEEKIRISSNVVLENSEDLSSDRLIQLKEELQVDEIHWLDPRGKIIYSSVEGYVGWESPSYHPLQEIIAGREELMEDLREDHKYGKLMKYGAVRREDGYFVQVGLSGERVEEIRFRFSHQALMDEIAEYEDIVYAIFVDRKNIKIASSLGENIGLETMDPGIRMVNESGERYFEEYDFNGKRVYDFISPLYVDGNYLGVLNIGYSMDKINNSIKNAIVIIYSLGILLSLVLIYILKRIQDKKILEPIIQINQDIARIDIVRNINYRLPLKGDDYFIETRERLNTVLEKSEDFFKDMIDHQEELGAMNEELEATIGQLSASEQELIARYEEIKEQKEEISFLAEKDYLTELYNKRTFSFFMEERFKEKKKGAIILLDIDNFKNINDTKGHIYGDMVLKNIGNKIKEKICNNNTVYRFGGDEFLVHIEGKSKVDEVRPCANRLKDIFNEKNIVEGIENYISISCGLVFYPEHGNSVDELLKKADIAMYEAKRAGKNQLLIYNEYMSKMVNEKYNIEMEIRHALENKGFKLVYQPIINNRTKETSFFEALIRFKDKNIYPDQFIPVAEETGIIREIGRWVIEEAMGQIARWRQDGRKIKPIAINMSPEQISDSQLIDFLKEKIAAYNIEKGDIEIEITENILAANKEENIEIIRQIKDQGMEIALDDFGTGYSSINYLTYLPVDKIKIDKSLKDKFIGDEKIKIIGSIISLAQAFDLKVVIEGVESQEEVEKLNKIGSDYLQGYVFSRPLDMEEIEKIYDKKY